MILVKLILCLTLYIDINAYDDSLVAVHVLFRHGDKCPDQACLYEASVYFNESYFQPYGFGQLTNKGKLIAYNLGKEIRQRYDGFLDKSYNIQLIDARSSDYNRTKASLQTMLAGLFPPTEELTWLPGLNWQPIPYTYVERNSDQELHFIGCQTWNSTFDKYLATEEGSLIVKKYDSLLETLCNKTGDPSYSELFKANCMYFTLKALEELNYALPDWSNMVYPYPLKNLTLDYYEISSATRTLRQMSGGYLLKHILHDTQEKIDGKFPKKKMYLWSGHENNIAAILSLMKVWKNEEIADYGSYVALELHNVNGTYGFKIYYKTGKNKPQLQKLPECAEFCALDIFTKLIEEDIPENVAVCREANGSSSTNSIPKIEYVFLAAVMCLLLFFKYT